MVRALEDTGRFNVISRPTIFTANNQRGMILSGQQIAIPTNSYNYGGINTGQSTNIEYRDVALSLEVVPLVNSPQEVTLQISLVSQDLGKERTIGTGANALTTNDINNRELLTTVTVPNNQTIVLGGLITHTDKNSVTGVPILSSIPGLGKLFSYTSKKRDRQELIIFIQPKIVNSDPRLQAAQLDMNSRYDSAQDVLDMAAGPILLPPQGSVPEPVEAPAPVKQTKAEPAPATNSGNGSSSNGKTKGKVSGHPGSVFRH
jgi:type II secretory pathway component GspD/PulD (secretin)